MTKFLLTLFIVSSLVSCNQSGGDQDTIDGVAAPVLSDTTAGNDNNTGGDTGLPNEAYTFDFNVKLINMSLANEEKIQKAMELVRRVFATEAFRKGILNHTYNGVKTFVDNGGYTNAQIYQKILDGAERLYPTKNNAMDMEIELYTDNLSNTVGYTNGGTVRIWMNTKYFNSFSAVGVTSNLTHEWLHKVGFGHAVSYSTSRDYSVPYAVGRLVSKIAGTLK